ncbi:MAG: M16 family peptidase [Parcubacteria group bacterium GW2011_GWA2_39_18]|nr:MAG: M16 family peptidase [Parcubacteria group bacterium GW2011_GWA2_39_18]
MSKYILRRISKSGLRILGVPLADSQSTTVLVLVGVGSDYENKKINGASHFLEHLMFKGTKKRPSAFLISSELDDMGAEYNAFTSNYYTGYYIKAEKNYLSKMLDVVSDMLFNSLYSKEEIERERGVIFGEIDMYEDMPNHHVEDVFTELLYKDQPPGLPVTGTKKSLKNISQRDIVNYVKDNYGAQNTVLVLSGRIRDEDLKLAEKYFEDLKRKKITEQKIPREIQKSPAIKFLRKKTDQTHFMLGSRAFSVKDKRRHIASVLSVILGGNMSSRLFIKIREREGLGYYIHSNLDLRPKYGFLAFNGGVHNDKILRAVDIIINELKDIKRNGANAEELERAKNYIEGKMLVGLDTSDALANFYASEELIFNKSDSPRECLKQVKKVSLKDVKNLAEEIFVKERLNLALIGPDIDHAGLYKILEKI